MSSQNYVEKLTNVLDLFLLPNYNIVSTTYLDILLSHISGSNEESKLQDQKYFDIYHKWVLKALDTWTEGTKPSVPIITFTLKLIGTIANDEIRFLDWANQNIYNRLCVTLNLRENDLSVSAKVAYIFMLSKFISHRSGRRWIIESGVWKDIVKYAHQNHTLYVTRESHQFLWKLLSYEQQNTNIIQEIILAIAEPLISNTFDAQTHQALEECYMDQNRLLCSTLDLITSIIENTLFISLDNNIPDKFEELVNLEMRVKALFEACISTKFLQHVQKLLLLILFLKLKSGIKEPNELINADVWQKFRFGLCYIFMMLLSKKYIIELVKTNKYSLVYWKKLRLLSEFELPEPHKFEHQAIALMVLPLFVCIKKDYMNHDLFDMFLNKLFDVTCTTVQRLAYNTRDVIYKSDLPLENICKVSIDLLLEMTDIMDRDVAVITFQTLCHVLKNYLPNSKESICATTQDNQSNPEPKRKQMYKSILEGDPIINNPILLSSILNGLAVMTEKFKLKWQECVETICVLSLAQEILNHTGILPMICVKALKVCKLAIHNFMPPNLALLIDSDSHMNELGPTLFKRLHDPNWEVKDSALEVLNTIAVISEDKYPAFQDFLLVNNFLPLSLEIAINDGESYVRSSALTFLSSTIRINKLWNEKLRFLDLLTSAIKLLDNESEGIVRREAVILVTELYVHRMWSKNMIEVISRSMAAAAVFDLHWEVKINAIHFWKHFIKSHLSDQGMLDGSFPNVTFSKEHRKIVALDEPEIKRRLNKALDELAQRGCLGVLLVALKDDSDFEVCKASANTINKLKTFLLKYKLDEPMLESPLPKDSAILDSSYVKPAVNISESRNETISDNASNVIEEILDANDTNLLASIYNNSMKMDCESPKKEEKTYQYISCVTRQEFLRVIFNSDLNAYIEEKNKWLKSYTNSFDSILDDIVTLHEQKDVNLMDCY